MHVSILVSTGAWGGAELYCVALMKRLLARGHEISVVELKGDIYSRFLHYYVQRVKVLNLSLAKPTESLTLKEAYEVLSALPRDVGVLAKGDFDTANWQLDFVARLWFRCFVSLEFLRPPSMPIRSSRTYFGVLPALSLWWLQLRARRIARSLGPHLVVTISEEVRQGLIQNYRFSPNKTLTVYGGVDTSLFQPEPAFRHDSRASWGIDEDAFVFGAVARLAAVKGFPVAIQLFQQLIREGLKRDTYLVLVGNGPEESELKVQAKATGLGEKIIFRDFTREPWRAFSGFDVFVMPSVTEGLGLALLESMACGCPGIAMDVGGVGEIITSSEVGWLIPEGSREAFFAAMKEAIELPTEQLVAMGKRARDRVTSHFEAKIHFEHLAEVIESANSEGYCCKVNER